MSLTYQQFKEIIDTFGDSMILCQKINNVLQRQKAPNSSKNVLHLLTDLHHLCDDNNTFTNDLRLSLKSLFLIYQDRDVECLSIFEELCQMLRQ